MREHSGNAIQLIRRAAAEVEPLPLCCHPLKAGAARQAPSGALTDAGFRYGGGEKKRRSSLRRIHIANRTRVHKFNPIVN